MASSTLLCKFFKNQFLEKKYFFKYASCLMLILAIEIAAGIYAAMVKNNF